MKKAVIMCLQRVATTGVYKQSVVKRALLILSFLSFHINFIISLLVYRENKDKRIKTHVWWSLLKHDHRL